MSSNSSKIPRPFLKWAGGKTQLLKSIENKLPADLNGDYKYFEPFVGGGAVFFKLKPEYNFKQAYLGDINKNLILTYYIIQNKPGRLISILKNYNGIYNSEKFDNKMFFYHVRKLFNEFGEDFNPLDDCSKNISHAAQMIFLNKTCFNGLYRVNKNGEFNVPFANPKNPLICDIENIYDVHDALENVELRVCDFSEWKECIDENSFVYLDPPYKPIDGKKSFGGYTKEGFEDSDQEKLAEFCKYIANNEGKNAKFLLSNSKPKENPIFDNLYKGFKITPVLAKRAINPNGKKRGVVEELLIYNNYETKKK